MKLYYFELIGVYIYRRLLLTIRPWVRFSVILAFSQSTRSLSFVTSRRGKKQLLHNNYVHNEYSRRNSVCHCRCSYYDNRRYTAKVHTTSNKKCGEVINGGKYECTQHNHIMDKSEVEAIKVTSKIKESAAKTTNSSINVVTRTTNSKYI